MAHKSQVFLFAILCIAAAGCSNSSSTGTNNNNNSGGNAVGVVGPGVGSVYVISITQRDTLQVALGRPIFDTALVVANNLTFEGRTNVLQVRDKYYDPTFPNTYFGNSYYGYDANGDFYKYDTTYPFQGWHHYPTGSKVMETVRYDTSFFGTTKVFGLTATASYTGTGNVTFGTLSTPTENVLEQSDKTLLQIDDNINIMYGNSIKFYAEMIDTLNNLNQVGMSGAINPIISTNLLISYSLK